MFYYDIVVWVLFLIVWNHWSWWMFTLMNYSNGPTAGVSKLFLPGVTLMIS